MNKLFCLIMTTVFLSGCSLLNRPEKTGYEIGLTTRNAVAEKIPIEFHDGKPVESDRSLLVLCPENNDSQWFVVSEWDITQLTAPPAAGRHIDRLSPSEDGKYLAILSADEGHPELTVVDLPALLAGRKAGYLHHINPYPEFIDLTRWEGTYLHITSNRPLNDPNHRQWDIFEEEEPFPATAFVLNVETGAITQASDLK